MRHYGERLVFHFEQQEKDEIVYSDSSTANEAIAKFHNSSSSEKVKVEQAAMILRRIIKQAFRNSDTLSWPPTAEFLTSGKIQLPELLTNFFNCLISGNSLGESQSTQKLSSSFARNLCRAVTNGKRKVPKHLLLAESLRHLFRSEELNTLIFRLGHCESYSFTLELETAIANSQQLSSQLLAPTIVPDPDFVFHCCWDNFDVIEETYSCSGTIHSAHGLKLQELPADIGVQLSSYQLDPIPGDKTRSIEQLLEADIPSYYKGQRKPPDYDFNPILPGGGGKIRPPSCFSSTILKRLKVSS